MNRFLSLLIGCSGCKPKPQEKPLYWKKKHPGEEVQEEQEETEEQIIEFMVANFNVYISM